MDPQLIQQQYEKNIGVPFTDSLTGLYNHGFFQTVLAWEEERFNRHGESFTLGLIDIDSFTGYNKSHGHARGDQVLKKVAALIKDNIRQVDLAARHAGDVFAILLIKAEAAMAKAAAERIREAVAKEFDNALTVSVGLASLPGDGSTKTHLIEKAQEALLCAKMRGTNKVHFFEKEKLPHDATAATILVVDDEPRNVKLLEGFLRPLNYEVIKAFDGEEALSLVNKTSVDLVLLDIMMPKMDGYEVCRRLKNSEKTRLIPIIMVTAFHDIEAKVKGIEAGADDFLPKPLNKIELQARTQSLVNTKKLNDKLTSIEDVLFALANAVEAKDSYTLGHTQRVADMAVLLGSKISLSEQEINTLRVGGILHDIGKIGVPRNILNKSGPLSEDEWEIMKQHPTIGYKICLPMKKSLGPALDMIQHHHEKLDGSGYPDGLRGEKIPTVARIMAVVDIYDALITDRPYRKGLSRAQALSILQEEADEGKLDKSVVEQLL